MQAYRIVKPAYAPSALSGEGARLYGGRWNPPGLRCVYAAGSRALAVLEMLVHLNGPSRALPYCILSLEIDDSLVAVAKAVPQGWKANPAGRASQQIGHEWLKANRSAALLVPSVIIPQEQNLLLNPLAPGFDTVRVTEEQELRLDQRLSSFPQ